MPDNWLQAKRKLGEYVLTQLTPNLRLGVGSGSTVTQVLKVIGPQLAGRTEIVVASRHSAEVARQVGISVIDPDQVRELDLVIDGADWVNRQGVLIKGGGASLVRERLVLSLAQRGLIVVDSQKPVERFVDVTVPVAVIPYAVSHTLKRIRHHADQASVRLVEGDPLRTDDGLYIVDAKLSRLDDPRHWHETVKLLEGVVDTGIFVGYPCDIVVSDGQKVWPFQVS